MSDNSVLLTKEICNEGSIKENKSRLLPYFIEIQRTNNKKVKIPCSSQIVANKVLEGLKRLKVTSTINLLT